MSNWRWCYFSTVCLWCCRRSLPHLLYWLCWTSGVDTTHLRTSDCTVFLEDCKREASRGPELKWWKKKSYRLSAKTGVSARVDKSLINILVVFMRTIQTILENSVAARKPILCAGEHRVGVSILFHNTTLTVQRK